MPDPTLSSTTVIERSGQNAMDAGAESLPPDDPNQVMVVGLGMMTSVGLTAVETAASVDAGISQVQDLDWVDSEGQPFASAVVPSDALPGLCDDLKDETDLWSRERRLLQLGTMPLLEAATNLPDERQALALALALPEWDAQGDFEASKYLHRFQQQVSSELQFDHAQTVSEGRAGGLQAIDQAVSWLKNKQVQFAIAGGIDSFCHLASLESLSRQSRLLSANCLDGLIPGEGAGFLLLARAETVAELGLKPMATVTPAVTGFEAGHLFSEETYTGDGLAAAMTEFLAEQDWEQPVKSLYSSMNGENHWAKELSVAMMRNSSRFDPDVFVHHPADCFGDCGAAAGPLMAGLACLLATDSDPTLIYGSSDRGNRAVLAIQTGVN